MKTVRVYKDNLREHILRTMFFTDTALFIGAGLILAVGTVYVYKYILHIDQIGLIISTAFLLELFFALIATVKIDHQPLYKIIPRAVTYTVTKKSHTLKELKKTTGDFKVVGDYLIHKKKLIAIYEIRPFDIALLNDEERERYYQHIKTMLHTLPITVQLIVRKQKAKVEDYHDHFFSLYQSGNEKTNTLIGQYIKELSNTIEANEFQLMKYYAVFSRSLTSDHDDHFVESAQKLEDVVRRFSSALALEKIQTMQLTHEQLIAYCKGQFRTV